MKSTFLRYGIYAGLLILVLAAIHVFVLMPPNISWEMAEVVGYLTMLLAMIFVFMGIRYYRDHVNNGYLTFGQGLKLGALIVLVPAVTFGLFDLLYTRVLHPSFSVEYMAYQVEKIKASVPADQLDQKLAKLRKDMEMFGNPFIEFLFMAITVYIVGLIVTIISALALRRSRALVAGAS